MKSKGKVVPVLN